MNFTQHSHTGRTSFHFDPDKLTHTRSDSHGSHSVSLSYGSIGMDPRMATERNGALFTGAVLLLVWGCAQAFHTAWNGDWSGLIFLAPGPFCLLLHAINTTTVTYLDSEDGDIAIFHDKNHDLIMAEILERRKRQLLEWYGSIDFTNDPEEEIRKFHWLHSQDLINADQLQRIVTTIRNADTHDQDGFDDHLPPRQ